LVFHETTDTINFPWYVSHDFVFMDIFVGSFNGSWKIIYDSWPCSLVEDVSTFQGITYKGFGNSSLSIVHSGVPRKHLQTDINIKIIIKSISSSPSP